MKSLTVSGAELTLIDISRNKKFNCKNDCWAMGSCELKRAVSDTPSKDQFTATAALINIKNFSPTEWSISLGNWELIDDEGFAFRAHNICEHLKPPKVFEAGRWSVSPGTQVNFMLVFPELEPDRKVAKLLYVKDGNMSSIDLNPLNPAAAKLFEVKASAMEKEFIENDCELRGLKYSLDSLESSVFSRLNNSLAPKEIKKIENSIQNECHRIEQQLKGLAKNKADRFQSRYSEIMGDYNSKIEKIKKAEAKIVDLDKKVSALYELTPREFEEYTAELFGVLGYENVKLTPETNDKGIDIFMEKNGKRCAVQCKKFKGVVGSPAIQTFIGSMKHAEVQHGFFVTTSTFSLEAEKMAAEHPIELVDSIKLARLIKEALGQPE
jgi:restriction system protein